jgi:formate/nitrite transporter FocA (FNT family)
VPHEEPRGGSAVPLRRAERRRAAERTAPGPQVVHEAIRREGEEELSRPAMALFWSGLAAGLSMGFSLVGEALLEAGLPDAPWRPLVAKLGYSLGFLFVVLGRQQLFTETTLTAVLPLLVSPSRARLRQVARVWGVVLLANLLGALLFAAVLATPGLFSGPQRQAMAEIGARALAATPGVVALRGVFGGWLIALMVWLLPASSGARFLVVLVTTWLVGAGQFSHSVAGAVDVLHQVVIGRATAGDFLGRFFVPTLIGNSVGGVALVAALNHAQVVAGRRATT